jgi:hypothetical protein
METLAFLLLVTMQRNNTRVVSVSMELFDYGCLVTTAFSQIRHIASSLRLFFLNGLTECNNPFLLDVPVVQSSRCFSSCSRCFSRVQSSRWSISSCSRYSLLEIIRLERFLDEVQAVSVYQSIFILFL